ncbi:MAG: GxxExxY protein [Verrucomicrobiota bacterium]
MGEASRRDAEARRLFFLKGFGLLSWMEVNEITGKVVDCAVKIHQQLGPGLLESVYQRILVYGLRKAGLKVETEVQVPVKWDGHVIDEGFRADVLVEGKVLLELKALEKTERVHRRQTLTYLKLLDLKVGLLINFGAALVKDDLHRLVNGLKE